MISIITCTQRPVFMNQIFNNYIRQEVNDKELIIILNQDNMDINEWNEEAKRYNNVFIYQLPEEYTLGRCMNYGIEKAHYNIIAKFDDDDYYASKYLKESVDALNNTDASIIGKSAAFIYFEEEKALTIYRENKENKLYKFIKGGTLVFKKSVWNKVKFPDRVEGSDSHFLRRSWKLGYKIYSVSRYNYVCIRRKDTSTHTQKISTKEYMAKCKLVCHTDHYIPLITKDVE
ncbi:glycosyltransferase family 2 protein [Oceanobacillus arenosus]|uniref:Glycosyltransferase family 2 protein n=1 Tax=Oceanobacillus arenosus TaxID=1229153 RepID=A0A3D8PMN4_9BACI|nr:glycosyltransferase [Oceanobacillus arenosus]RDW16405.1 glycosyltransferase family 2 protein [Oceanobacillus arenosus]